MAEVLKDTQRWDSEDPDSSLDKGSAQRAVGMVKILISHHLWFETGGVQEPMAYETLVAWLRDTEVQRFIQVNRYGGVLWFNKEAFEQFLGWMLTVAVVEISAQPGISDTQVAKQIVACYDLLAELRQAADMSEFQIAGLLEAAQGQTGTLSVHRRDDPGGPVRPKDREE